jgi:hypothetical protein
MGNIRCLNCRNEITTISGMECPHCRAQLSHVKIAFLSFLGPEDSLIGYMRSYKLVLLKCVFSMVKHGQDLSVKKVTEAFRDYYLVRIKEGLPADRDVDNIIANIESSSLSDIWRIIQTNPLASIEKTGTLRVVGVGLTGEFVLKEELRSFTDKELENLIDFLDRKLEFYYWKINSRAVKWDYLPPVSQQETSDGTAPITVKETRAFAEEEVE